MRRSRFNHFFLIIAALGVLLLGYYLGNRYQYAELRNLPIELYPEPIVVDAAYLPDELSQKAEQGHWLILLSGIPHAACDALLRHYLEVYNRLAVYPEVQKKLYLALLSDREVQASLLWQHMAWAQVYPMEAANHQQLFAALQLPPIGNRWCQDVQATTALLSPDRQHYASLPLDEPQQMVKNLQALISALDSGDVE